MRKLLYCLLQATWGLLQTFVGFVLYIVNINKKHYSYHGAVVTEWKSRYCVSLGMFVFVTHGTGYNDRLLVHEYGHTIQSLLLGPLYLLVIGFPSLLWCALPLSAVYRKKSGVSYYSFYPEKWADYLGEKVTGIKLNNE